MANAWYSDHAADSGEASTAHATRQHMVERGRTALYRRNRSTLLSSLPPPPALPLVSYTKLLATLLPLSIQMAAVSR
jgi:hypothetical protein